MSKKNSGSFEDFMKKVGSRSILPENLCRIVYLIGMISSEWEKCLINIFNVKDVRSTSKLFSNMKEFKATLPQKKVYWKEVINVVNDLNASLINSDSSKSLLQLNTLLDKLNDKEQKDLMKNLIIKDENIAVNLDELISSYITLVQPDSESLLDFSTTIDYPYEKRMTLQQLKQKLNGTIDLHFLKSYIVMIK